MEGSKDLIPQTSRDVPPPYPGYPSQFGNQGQPSYPAEASYPVQSGYQAQPGYPVQASYPPGHPGYAPQAGYPAQPGYSAYPGYPQQSQSVNIAHPGQVMIQPVQYHQAPPQDYLGLAWFACLCCCWPLGIVSIMKSNEARSAIARGDIAQAQTSSLAARNFAYLAICLGLGFLILYIIILVIWLVPLLT